MPKKKILIIDDNAAILDVLGIILEDDGFDVMTKLNGETLKKDIKRFMPDLIFLDVMLQGENGIEIARNLKGHKETSDISIVLISASSNMKKKLSESKADDFLPKPFELKTLIEKAKKYA